MKPRLLLLFPGPMYHLTEVLRLRLELLSQQYEGLVVAQAPKGWQEDVGSFQVTSLAIKRRGIFGFVQYALAVRDAIKSAERPFDLIVTYDPLRSGLTALLLRSSFGVPVAVEVNGDYSNENNYSDYSRVAGSVRRRMYMRVQKYVCKRADGVKALYAGQFKMLGPPQPRQVRRNFPNLVDVGRFHPIRDQKVILSVGFPWRVKGMDVLIQAFKSVKDKIPGWSLRLVGHFQNDPELLAYAGDDKDISIEKAVRSERMPEIIGTCGVFVLASRTEAMGRVLVEAMAARKARVASAVGGVPTVIEDEVDGLLVPVGDVRKLGDAIVRVVQDEDLRKHLADNAEASCREKFSPQVWLKNSIDFYSAVLADGSIKLAYSTEFK